MLPQVSRTTLSIVLFGKRVNDFLETSLDLRSKIHASLIFENVIGNPEVVGLSF